MWGALKPQLIAQYAYDNADIIVSVRDPHKPTDTVKELMRQSRDTGKVIEYSSEDDLKYRIVSMNESAGEAYAALFNLQDDKDAVFEYDLTQNGLNSNVKIVNMWTGETREVKDITKFKETLKPHCSVLYKIIF